MQGHFEVQLMPRDYRFQLQLALNGSRLLCGFEELIMLGLGSPET